MAVPWLACLQSSLLAPSARIAMDMFNVTELVQHARPLAEQVLTTLLNEPAHLIVEAVLFIFVLVLLCKRSYVIPKDASSMPLSEAVRFHSFFAIYARYFGARRNFSSFPTCVACCEEVRVFLQDVCILLRVIGRVESLSAAIEV